MTAPDAIRGPCDGLVVHRSQVRDGVEIAYWREGVGGTPLLLVHGWPETKLIWERNVLGLAERGYEVIAPDLRGFGDSAVPGDGFQDLVAHSADLSALIVDVLGHRSCCAAAGDLGGGVIQDMSLRYPGLVDSMVIFNSILPLIPDEYEAAGLPKQPTEEVRANAGYFLRQGRDADGLCEELADGDGRVAYVASFYLERHWTRPGSFTAADAARMAEPFRDPERFRDSLGNYESALGNRRLSGMPRFFEVNPIRALILYGPEDHVIPREFPAMCEVAFPNRSGPEIIDGTGHFLQWEAAGRFNDRVAEFLGAG